LGAPVELLDAQGARQKVGSSAYRGALLDSRAGTVQPLAYARGLARAAMAFGATIHTSSAVISAQRVAEQWRIKTKRGGVTAPRVIVGTNAYSQALWRALQPGIPSIIHHHLQRSRSTEAPRAQNLLPRQTTN
jgi:glycine/D-amino acid oxidase-like deaminating enzyme